MKKTLFTVLFSFIIGILVTFFMIYSWGNKLLGFIPMKTNNVDVSYDISSTSVVLPVYELDFQNIGNSDIYFNILADKDSIIDELNILSQEVISGDKIFIDYMKEVIVIIQKNQLFSVDDFILETNKELAGETNDYDHINRILYNLYYYLEDGEFTDNVSACTQELNRNLEDTIFSTEGLLYSNFVNSGYFNRGYLSQDEQRMKFSQKFDDALLFSGVSDFSQLENLNIGIRCEKSEPEYQQKCNELREALIDNDTDFIRGKFESNGDEYDIDTMYIEYRIGDYTKEELISNICA